MFDDLFDEGSKSERHCPGLRDVLLKDCDLPAGKGHIGNVEVGLVIQREAATVEVGGPTNTQSSSHDHDLAVVHGRLILENLDARARSRHIMAPIGTQSMFARSTAQDLPKRAFAWFTQ